MEKSEQNVIAAYLSKRDVEQILTKHGIIKVFFTYYIEKASNKMLGFLCDYLRLKVQIQPNNRELCYFLKVVPISNMAKAEIVKDLNLIEKEVIFYSVIKENILISGGKLWTANYITGIRNGIVFEDMAAIGYKHRDKYKRFDKAHTLEALKSLARFHASSIVFEENKTKERNVPYSLKDDYEKYFDTAGYEISDPWYEQCMKAALEALKTFSKYTKDQLTMIEKRWENIWAEAVALANPSSEYRNVVCHRDLWNNNIMFHYDEVTEKPDNCIFIDFQAIKYMPPAGDVMLLLYCNLERKYREANMEYFLNFYIDDLHNILLSNKIDTAVISKAKFLESAKEHRKWGIVIAACLMPISWIDDNETSNLFGDTEKFNEIVMKNKAPFIINMMKTDSDYKKNVMTIFEEIAERYCFAKTATS